MTSRNYALSLLVLTTGASLILSLAVLAKDDIPGTPKNSSAVTQADWKPCPNSCLKLSNRGWCYQNMPGKPDYLIWMNFPYKEPSGGGEAWSVDHLGQIIRYEGTRPFEKGTCPTCQGRLYIGDPTKRLLKKGPIPVHPLTTGKENQTVLGRPWVKLTVRAAAGDLAQWYYRQLPASGWAIVDSTRVQGSTFYVITNGASSKWMKISASSLGNSEVILMSR